MNRKPITSCQKAAENTRKGLNENRHKQCYAQSGLAAGNNALNIQGIDFHFDIK